MTFCIIWWQPTCSMSTRMFVPGHQPGLFFVFYHLWDQNQSGMSVGVIQSLWGTLSWWWYTMIACWGNLPSRLNVRKKNILKLNFIMFCNIYNVSIIIKFKYSLKLYELKNMRGGFAWARWSQWCIGGVPSLVKRARKK